MRRTTTTSRLFLEARAKIARERVPQFIQAFNCRDFDLLAELTMRESNELHALCLDTWPPAVYLNATSFAIMEFVHTLNHNARRKVVCFLIEVRNLSRFHTCRLILIFLESTLLPLLQIN